MALFVNTFFEERLDQLFSLADLIHKIFTSAGLEYRLVGGLATYLYVEEAVPDAGRLTKDIDIVVTRKDVDRIATAAQQHRLEYRQVEGTHMLMQAQASSARRAVHLIFAGEKVRPEYSEAVPPLGQDRIRRGLRLIPLVDLVHMKLTSFRATDEAHVKDLDDARLITPEIESTLSPILMERLIKTRTR